MKFTERSVTAGLFYAGGARSRTDSTDMTKLTDAFPKFCERAKKCILSVALNNNALQKPLSNKTLTHYVIFEIRDSGWGEILIDGEDSKDGQDGNS